MKKFFNKVSQGLQKFGPAIMPVIAVLPIAGFLDGIGAALQQDALIKAIPILGSSGVQTFAVLINSIGNLILGNLGLWFAIGVAMNMAGKKAMAAFSAALAFLTMHKTIEVIGGITSDMVADSTAYASVLGINTLQCGVFGGLMIGLLVYWLYKRFHDIKLPAAFSFFQGERFVPIVSVLGGIVMGLLMLVVWPPIQSVFDAFTNWLINTPYRFLAIFLYGFVMRLVQAFGLQHLIYPFFYFQMGSYVTKAGVTVTGESSIFFAQMADGVPVTVGGFMTGSYINSIMCVAVAIAIVHNAKPSRKKDVKSLMTSGAVTVAFTGVSEPIEFSYLLVSPFLWLVNSIMVGLGYAVTDALEIRLGTGLAGNIIDYILYGIIPQSKNWYLLIPVGAVFFFAQLFLFNFFIKKFDIKTPGREDDEDVPAQTAPVSASEMAFKMVEYMGGRDNIVSAENCFTRVRAVVKDRSKVNKNGFLSLGASGVVEPGENGVQVIFGPQSEQIVNDMKAVMEGRAVKDEPVAIENKAEEVKDVQEAIMGEEDFVAPMNGTIVPLEKVPDPVFSQKMMGEGFAVQPDDGEVVSPVNGKVTTVFPTKHAIGITTDLGKEVIVHMGLDTVDLNGKGFEVHVKENDDVQCGTPLATIDTEYVKAQGKNLITPVVMSNIRNKNVTVEPQGKVARGQKLNVKIQ